MVDWLKARMTRTRWQARKVVPAPKATVFYVAVSSCEELAISVE